jgi:hypothetical protein
MSNYTGTVQELLYASTHVGIAKNTFTSEVTINDIATMGVQARLPADFWLPNNAQSGRGIRIVARGILSSTGTPTYTPTIRLGTSGSTLGPIILGTAGGVGLTTTSGAANAPFEIDGEVVLTGIGAAGGNSTLQGIGRILSPGLATSYASLYGGAASPGTVATADTSISNYINVNVACSASSASNTITLQQLLVYSLG